jgi:hypothetical protein
MNPRNAEQLLYDSEATLRLVDTLLDELQVMEPKLQQIQRGDDALHLEPELDEEELPELLEAAADQTRAVLKGLSQSRSVLERTSREKHRNGSDEDAEAPTAFEIRGGLERALLLVDRLEHEPDPQPVRDLLRQEILEMIEAIRAQEITEQQLTYASSVLNQTESGLAALLESLSPSRNVIPFPGGWVTG